MYDYTLKIIVVGDNNVGKSTLIENFLSDIFPSNSIQTIGVDFYTKELKVNGKIVKLQVWVFGAEERFKSLLPQYIRGANGALVICDLTNKSTFAHIDEWLSIITTYAEFPILIVGNKVDMGDERGIPYEEAIELAKLSGVDGYIECSFKGGENVADMFVGISRLIIEKKY